MYLLEICFKSSMFFGSLQYIHLINLCFSFILVRTKRVLGVLNCSRTSNAAAVSREVPMTKELLTYIKETQVITFFFLLSQ